MRERFDELPCFVEAALGELLLHGVFGGLEAALPQVCLGRQLADFDLLLGQPLDVLEEPLLARRRQRDRHAFTADAARAPDAVHVHLRRRRQVEVDHMRHVLDVEPARGHVGGHEDVGLLAAEQLHHAVALLLHHAAVQRLRAVAMRVERVGELVDLDPRAAEDDGRLRALEIQDAAEGADLLALADDEGDLADLRQLARGALLLGDLHALGRLEVLARDRQDARREGRGEERRLPRRRRLGHDGVDVFGEAHVEHLVGFVEHEHFDGAELERAPAQVIEHAPRGADHDLRAAAQRADLVVHRRAAVDGHDVQVRSLRVLVQGLGDLHRQLARGHEHEGAGLAAIGPGVTRQPIEQRQRERRRLAGAGCGQAEHVAAREQDGDGLALNRRGFFVAERGDRGHERRGQSERRKTGGVAGGRGLHGFDLCYLLSLAAVIRSCS